MMLASAFAQEIAASETGDKLTYVPILVFGGAALVAVAVLQGMRILQKGAFSANFTRLYGLVMIATFASVLVFADVDEQSETGAFTLLGTIAGYLAGAKPTSTGSGAGGGGDGGGGEPNEEGGEAGRKRPRKMVEQETVL